MITLRELTNTLACPDVVLGPTAGVVLLGGLLAGNDSVYELA